MKVVGRLALALLSALLAVVLCILFTKLDEAVHILPKLPAYGGEDDFSARADAFFGFLVPAFAVMGAALGWFAWVDFRRCLRGWAGMLLGSAVFCGVSGLASPTLRGMATTSAIANRTFVALMITWVVLAGSAAWFTSQRRAP